LPELDGVRGIAVLMVIVFHAFWFNQFYFGESVKEVMRFAILGQTGVDLFFVLSGFLITRILLATKGKKYQIRNFYIRRLLRIFPLYYMCLIIFFLVIPLLSNDFSGINNIFSFHFWSYILYLQGFTFTFLNQFNGPVHFWSLAVEEHFYIFWPFFVLFFSVSGLIRTSLILIFVCIVSRIVLKYL